MQSNPIPDAAILKAIEGGYRPPPKIVTDWRFYATDPGFFQALGKALGWFKHSHEEFQQTLVWKAHAQVFYDLILTGGDTEKFWNELLK